MIMKSEIVYSGVFVFIAGFFVSQSGITIKQLPVKCQLQQTDASINVIKCAVAQTTTGASDGKNGLNAVPVKQAITEQSGQTTIKNSKSDITNNRQCNMTN